MDETKNTDENCIFNMFTTQKERVFDHGDGIYIYSEGERYIDASSGSISNSLGYNVKEMGLALKEQADKMAFLSRMCGVSPILAEASNLVCGLTNGAMIKAFFVSGGRSQLGWSPGLDRRKLPGAKHGRARSFD